MEEPTLVVDKILTLYNGKKIDLTTGKVVVTLKTIEPKLISIPTNVAAVNKITAVNATIESLPDVPKNMNIVSVILSYTLFGLSSTDIAIILDTTVEQVENIKISTVYEQFSSKIVETLVKTTQQDVRSIFSQHAHNAATKIVNLVDSDNESISLAASKDLLDRDGHRPADVVEHKHSMEDSLEIIHITKDETKENNLPPINIFKDT